MLSPKFKAATAAILLTAGLAAGCTDASRARFGGLGDEAKVDVYSGGNLIASYVSTGKVQGEAGSGYYFRDKATGKLTEVNGDVIITYGWTPGLETVQTPRPAEAPRAPQP